MNADDAISNFFDSVFDEHHPAMLRRFYDLAAAVFARSDLLGNVFKLRVKRTTTRSQSQAPHCTDVVY